MNGIQNQANDGDEQLQTLTDKKELREIQPSRADV
jgi:hypothetical protein